MPKARKKPVEIDFFSVQPDTHFEPSNLMSWIKSFGDKMEDHFWVETKSEPHELRVKTLEGISYAVTSEDVIIRGVNGEYYPCKKDIFLHTYDII